MTEVRALQLSCAAALLLGVIGVAASVLTASQAVLLDGLFNLCYFVTALATLHVARLLQRPDDARYPFGYLYFEPLINAVKGLLMLGVVAVALFDAAAAILAGGREVALGGAIVYAVFATLLCSGLSLLLWRATRRTASPLLRADAENWTVNGAISGAMLIAFLLAFLLIELELRQAARYVDPVVVVLVVLLSIGLPVRIAGRAILALLNRAPPEEVVAPLAAAARAELADLGAREIYVRVVRPGRTAYVAVHVLLSAEHRALTVGEADLRRHRLLQALAAKQAPILLDLLFTADPTFAAPTAGFTAVTPA